MIVMIFYACPCHGCNYCSVGNVMVMDVMSGNGG